MRPRRFRPSGPAFLIDGVWFRIVPGRKSKDDLRLEWWAETGGGETAEYGWRAVTFIPCMLMADFFYENEEALYVPRGGQGGKFFAKRLMAAMADGWRTANASTQEEKRKKNEKELEPS